MINANELRIGNWVQYEGTFVRVVRVTNEFVIADPIPLTEDWFNRFEFENDTANGFIKDSIHIEYIAQVGYVFFINGDVNGESIKIEYVHELQNLFFALRKQELG